MTADHRQATLSFIFFLGVIALFLIIGGIFHFDAEAFKSQLAQLPLLVSAIVFIGLYVGLTFLIWIGPKDVLRIVSAVLYGPYLGTLLVWIGEMGNVLTMFTLSRRLGRGFVEGRLAGKMQRIDEAIAQTSGWNIFFVRFFPVIPFRFSDLGFGLTKISLKKYWLICAVSSIFRIFLIQYFLTLGMSTAMNPQALGAYLEKNPGLLAVTLIYLLGTFIFLFYIFRNKKRTAQNGMKTAT
jgi:uncharacterized membrane protein YdjX (TVP38/TMEM64 family)